MNKQTENIHIKVSRKLKTEIIKMADVYGLNISSYIRMLLNKDIKKENINKQ